MSVKVVPAFNPSTRETEQVDLCAQDQPGLQGVQGQPRIHREILVPPPINK